MSAEGLEPLTNGLKDFYPVCAFYDQEPALFHESFGRMSNEALGINYNAESTDYCPMASVFCKAVGHSGNKAIP
jgi:hypothetical protein